MQRQGYPSLDRAWGAAVRADFVPLGDRAVNDPGQRVAVSHNRRSRRSLRDPITQSLGWAVRDSKTPGALVVRGRWSSGGVGRSQASGNHVVGQSRRRAITSSRNHVVAQSRSRAITGVGKSPMSDYGLGQMFASNRRTRQ